jgi:lipoprotein NlpI
MTKRSLLLIVLVLSLGILTVQAKETWIKIDSDKFTFISNTSESKLRDLAAELEQFHLALTLIFPTLKTKNVVPTRVLIFKDHASYHPFKPRYKGKIKENVAGYFRKGLDLNYITLTADPNSLSPYRVIFHEYAHFIIDRNLVHAPLWLNEGIAEFYSTFKTEDGMRKTLIGSPISYHIYTLRDKPLLPLKTLLAVDQRSPHYNESSKAGIFYAQSWALVHYLMLGNNGKRQPQLANFIRQLNTGKSLEENFKESFQCDYKVIEEELSQYIRKFSFPIVVFNNLQLGEITKQIKGIEKSVLSEAEIQYYQGDLLLRANYLKEAEKYIHKSHNLNETFAPNHISYGILLTRQKKLSEAKRYLERAIELDPRDYLAHLHYGHLLSRESKHEEALKSYQKASQLKPEMCHILANIGFTYLDLKRDKEANEAFIKILKLPVEDVNYYLGRSHYYLREAKHEHAILSGFIYLHQVGWRDLHSSYAALNIYLGNRRAGHEDNANKILKDALKFIDRESWPYPVFKYLNKDINEKELLALAIDTDKLTEAHAYIGMSLLIAGEKDGAINHFKWVKENGNKNFTEHSLSIAELVRLGKEAIKEEESEEH